jgi:hypothetical protein
MVVKDASLTFTSAKYPSNVNSAPYIVNAWLWEAKGAKTKSAKLSPAADNLRGISSFNKV